MKNVLGAVRKFWLVGAMVGLMSMALVACGDSNTATNTPVPTSVPTAGSGAGPSDVKEHAVALNEWSINPSTLEVAAGKVKFTVTNDGQFDHNLVIEGKGKTPDFTKGDGPQTLEVDLTPGTYKWLCDITGHAEKGMTGELTVK